MADPSSDFARVGPDSVVARLALAGLLLGLGFALARGATAAQGAATAALCLVVVVGGAWEQRPWAAGAWASGASAAHLTARLASAPDGSAVEQALGYLGVPAVLMLLAWQSFALTARFARAMATNEVARAKLMRSNRELLESMAHAEEAFAKLSAVVDNLEDGLLAATADGRIELANPALARLLEVESVRLGTEVRDALPEPLQELITRCCDRRETCTAEVVLRDSDHGVAVASPVHTEQAMWGAVVLLRDVTLERQVERMKSDFVATVSHEMRTPLTSLLGFAKLTRKQLDRSIFPLVPAEDEKARRVVGTVRGNLDVLVAEGKRLTALINDVLDLSKMESGQMVWRSEAVPARDAAERALAACSGLFDGRPQVRLSSELPAELPAVVADPDRLQQVLLNLLSNAAKFTLEGQVTLSARQVHGFVEFAVQDTGSGIRPGDQVVVFEKFRQVGEVLTDRPEGTGLGLPICREIITHLGGRIWVESALGEGSRFAFTLPCASPAESEPC